MLAPVHPPRRSEHPPFGRRRAVAAGGLLAAAVAAGAIVVTTGGGRPDQQVVERYASAWARGDTFAMYRELSDETRARTSLKRFARTMRRAAETSTLQRVRVGRHAHDRSLNEFVFEKFVTVPWVFGIDGLVLDRLEADRRRLENLGRDQAPDLVDAVARSGRRHFELGAQRAALDPDVLPRPDGERGLMAE